MDTKGNVGSVIWMLGECSFDLLATESFEWLIWRWMKMFQSFSRGLTYDFYKDNFSIYQN